MKGETGKLGVYAVSGVLVAALIISALFLSGIRFPTIEGRTGSLMVLLTDAPVDLAHLNITIDGFSVRASKNGSEGWLDIPFANGNDTVYFDLLALENVTMELATADIPVGNYTKMRFSVKTANATFVGGDTVDLKVPPGRIDVQIRFEIVADDTTVLLVDMQADWVAISKTNHLRPVLKASVVQ